MPKERIRESINCYDVLVGWSEESGYAQIAVVQAKGKQPSVRIGNDNEIYDGLYHTFSEESLDELIRVLQRVKRKVF